MNPIDGGRPHEKRIENGSGGGMRMKSVPGRKWNAKPRRACTVIRRRVETKSEEGAQKRRRGRGSRVLTWTMTLKMIIESPLELSRRSPRNTG
jgi:hypothetical protein